MSPRRPSVVTLTLACVCMLGLLVPPAHAAGTTLLGVYYGNQGWKMEQVRHMEAWQGKKHAVVNLFTNWCNRSTTMKNLFEQQLINIWNNGNVPMITWEPFLCSSSQTPADVEARAARGEYDSYLQAWRDRMMVFLSGPDARYGTADDRRAYLRLGHEMNGDWYPWGAAMGNNFSSDYIGMWRHVHGIVTGPGIDGTRLQWVWTVNHDDVGGFQAETFYPGDSYVDWVAIDGYNWGESQSWSDWKIPAQSYNAMIARLRAITTKPLALTELGSSTSTTSGTSVASKAQWISDVFNYVLANDVRMVAWFNEDKETDWAVFGGANGDRTYKVGRITYNTYSAYKSAVGGAGILASDSSNPRLLTDAQFAGQ